MFDGLTKASSPHPTQFFFCDFGAVASKKVQLIITKELDMQNKATSANLPPRNRHKIKLECFCSGVVAWYSQYVSPWTVTPKLTVGKGGN